MMIAQAASTAPTTSRTLRIRAQASSRSPSAQPMATAKPQPSAPPAAMGHVDPSRVASASMHRRGASTAWRSISASAIAPSERVGSRRGLRRRGIANAIAAASSAAAASGRWMMAGSAARNSAPSTAIAAAVSADAPTAAASTPADRPSRTDNCATITCACPPCAAARHSSSASAKACPISVSGRPGAGNLQCCSGRKGVDEHPVAIGREEPPRQLGLPPEPTQRIGKPIGGDAAQVIVNHGGILILAHDQVSARCNAQIVAIVELIDVIGFKEQLNRVTPAAHSGDKAKDLPQLRHAAAGAAEIELALAHVQPLTARENGRALRRAASAQIILWCLDIVEIDPVRAVIAPPLQRCAIVIARIRWTILQHQRLQLAALGQPARCLGNEAEEQPVIAVLGHKI